jgi:hypothetical protein
MLLVADSGQLHVDVIGELVSQISVSGVQGTFSLSALALWLKSFGVEAAILDSMVALNFGPGLW